MSRLSIDSSAIDSLKSRSSESSDFAYPLPWIGNCLLMLLSMSSGLLPVPAYLNLLRAFWASSIAFSWTFSLSRRYSLAAMARCRLPWLMSRSYPPLRCIFDSFNLLCFWSARLRPRCMWAPKMARNLSSGYSSAKRSNPLLPSSFSVLLWFASLSILFWFSSFSNLS